MAISCKGVKPLNPSPPPREPKHAQETSAHTRTQQTKKKLIGAVWTDEPAFTCLCAEPGSGPSERGEHRPFEWGRRVCGGLSSALGVARCGRSDGCVLCAVGHVGGCVGGGGKHIIITHRQTQTNTDRQTGRLAGRQTYRLNPTLGNERHAQSPLLGVVARRRCAPPPTPRHLGMSTEHNNYYYCY